MKRFLVSFLCVLLLAAAADRPAAAQEPQKKGTIRVKIAVIDIQGVQRNAAAVKDIRSQVEAFRVAYQSEIQKEEEALRTAQQELARQRAILAPEAFTEERRKFEKRLADLQRKVQQRKQELNKILNEAMSEVQKALNETIVAVAQEFDFTLVLRKDQTVLVAKPLNITETVLQRLDQRLPTVKVSEPGK